MSLAELLKHCSALIDFSTEATLHPVCLTWPMVFLGAVISHSPRCFIASRLLALGKVASLQTIAQHLAICHSLCHWRRTT
jgi:hypothetical protein